MPNYSRRDFVFSAAGTVASCALVHAAKPHIVGIGGAGTALLDSLPGLSPANTSIFRITTAAEAGSFLPSGPVVLLVGLGGRTGSVVAPRIAQRSLEAGFSCTVVASMPFAMEGPARLDRARLALEELRSSTIDLRVVDFQAVLDQAGRVEAAFKRLDDVVRGAVRA